MVFISQTECFKRNKKFFRFLGIWPEGVSWPFYKYYSYMFTTIFIFLYDLLPNINFYFLPRQLDRFVEELIFSFTEVTVSSKVLTFLLKHEEILEIMTMLESDVFQPSTDKGVKIIEEAKKFNVKYWKFICAFSLTSHFTHILSPLLAHVTLSVPLELPLCSYSFIPDNIKETYIYPIYFYQCIGMNCHVWFNINIDTYFLGLMILMIAQLDILDEKLRNVTNVTTDVVTTSSAVFRTNRNFVSEKKLNDEASTSNLNQCIQHFDNIAKFCSLLQQIFGITLFIQFSMASCIICVCLFRFILPAPWQYYVFLGTYMSVMLFQIMIPCWYGTRIMDKSTQLSSAVYDSDWTSRSRGFKSNLRLFVERTKQPLSIVGWKMFPLSLVTFTSIMNSAYSFFTLLRHMQSR